MNETTTAVSDGNMIAGLVVMTAVVSFPILLKFVFGVGAKLVMLRNPETGQIKRGYWGYSWTYLLFGFRVLLIRGEPGTAALHLLFSIVTAGLWQLVVSFLYNAQYTNRRIAEGFKLASAPLVNQAAADALGIDLASDRPLSPV